MNRKLVLSPARLGTLLATDAAANRLLGYLIPPGTAETPAAVVSIKAHYPSARQAVQGALQFAQWLEERGQESQRVHRIAGPEFSDFFETLFGAQGPSSVPDEQVERALEEVSTHVGSIEALAETVMRTMVDAETTVLRLVARREAARILTVVDQLCQLLDEYAAAAGALGGLPSNPAGGA